MSLINDTACKLLVFFKRSQLKKIINRGDPRENIPSFLEICVPFKKINYVSS